MKRAAAAIARSTAMLVAGLAIVVAASGWLYLLRTHASFGGPLVGDALPLDELSRTSAVPLPVYVAVWAAAGFLLAFWARALGIERLTAALLLGLGVGTWTYLATSASVLVIRQIPAHDALDAAATTRAVVIPPLLAGLAAALVAPTRTAVRPRAPFILACFVATAGLLGVIDAVQPQHHRTLLDALAPERVAPLARAFEAPLGLALVVVARGLARRKRRAWRVAVALLALSATLHVLYGFRFGALEAGLLAIALVARRRDFTARGDPTVRARLGAAVSLVAIYVYGALALWANRLMADQPFTLGFALRETTAALAGLRLHGAAHLSGDFASWFPASVLLLGAAAALWLLSASLAPWRHRVRQEANERALARDLVRAWGADTLAPFVLRADKSYFFTADQSAFLAYRTVGGVAIVSGDPIGPQERFDELTKSFIEYAHSRDWRIAILGASESRLDVYRRHGLHALYHGDEAVVETASFSLDGRAIRKVRQSIHRLERAGYTARVWHAGEIDRRLRAQLEEVARVWRGDEPNRGFAMALDTLFQVEDAVFVVGFRPSGEPAGFLHFALCRSGSALSLSSMPRLADTPNGFNEWLVCIAVEWARVNGYARVSLNFAPFAALLAPAAELSAMQKAQRQALLRLKGRFQLDNLLTFNRKFLPAWERRFVVYERRMDLPRVGIAALAAEAYLPFTGKERR